MPPRGKLQHSRRLQRGRHKQPINCGVSCALLPQQLLLLVLLLLLLLLLLLWGILLQLGVVLLLPAALGELQRRAYRLAAAAIRLPHAISNLARVGCCR